MGDDQRLEAADPQRLYSLLIQELADYAIFLIDAAGRIVTWNAGVQRILGYTESEFVGQDVAILFTPEDSARGEPERERRLAAENGRAADVRWHRRKDGSLLFVDGVIAALRDSGGALLGFSKVMKDMTVQRLALLEREESRARLDAALEASGTGTFQWHAGERCLSVDHQLNSLFGFEPAETPSLDDLTSRIVPEDRDVLHGMFERCRDEAGRFDYDFRVRTPQGKERWLRARGAAVRGADGSVSVITGAMLDISDRKRMESALAKSEARYREIVETAREGIWTIDSDGRTVFANERMAELLGVEGNSLMGRSSFDFVIEEDLPAARALFEAKLRGDRAPFEFRLRRSDGAVVWASVSGTPMYSEDGQLTGLLAMFTDITERKRAEDALRETENRFRQAFAGAPVGMVIVDPGGRILHANTAYQQITGWDQEDLRGTLVWIRTHDEDQPEYRRIWQELLQGERDSFHLEKRSIRQDGETVWMRVSATRQCASNDGGAETIIAIVEDITARKRAEADLIHNGEELARSNADLQQFAYVTSHDLQEPLRNIASFAQLLERQSGDKTTAEYTRIIVDSAHRMRNLIDALLSFSRVINVDTPPHAPVDLNTAFHWARMNLQAIIQETGAEVSADELPKVNADHVQMVQLLQNLMSNALKYRSAAPPRVHVSAERDGVSCWRIAVRDNGIGIPPEYSERIFGVFKRLHGKDVPGTGIGLAICQRIVQRHGGRIWVESEPDAGSTFFFTLPG